MTLVYTQTHTDIYILKGGERKKNRHIHIFREGERERESGHDIGVIAIIVRYGHGDPSSNPEQGYLCFTKC